MNADAEKPADPAAEPGPPDAPVPTPRPAPPPPRRWLACLQQALPDIVIVVSLLALFGLVHRFVQYVEFGGDAVAKWQFVRTWWFGNDLAHGKWDHHACRMGVNVITFVVQAICGRNWRAYYVGPFFMAMLQVPFVYLIGKRVINRLAGVLAVLIITYLETVHRSASQLLPDGFVGTYAIVACYLLLRLADAPDAKKRAWLYGLSAVAFFGYEAKETFVFFYPGLVVALWLVRRNVREVATFLGILLGGLLLETGLYATFTNYSSRYAAIRGTHGANGDWPTVDASGLFFHRFSQMTDVWKYLMFFSLASALWLVALHRQPGRPGRAVALIGVSHVFFLNFTVKGINPIELWQGFDPRYMDPFTPFGGLLVGCLLAAAIYEGWIKLPQFGRFEAYGPSGSPALAAAWSCVFVGGLAWSTFKDQRANPPPDAFALGARLASLANSTYDRNLPMTDPHRSKSKDLAAIYDVYMSDKRLAKNGKLPDFDEAKVVHARRRLTYLVKDPSVYKPQVLEQLEDAGCVIQVSRNKRGYVMRPFEPLPKECDAVLAKAIQQ